MRITTGTTTNHTKEESNMSLYTGYNKTLYPAMVLWRKKNAKRYKAYMAKYMRGYIKAYRLKRWKKNPQERVEYLKYHNESWKRYYAANRVELNKKRMERYYKNKKK